MPMMRYDVSKTARFKRAICTNAHGAMLDLLREFGRIGAVISKPSAHETPRNPKGYVCDSLQNLIDVSPAWMDLVTETEALDRSDEWEELGVWVPLDE